MSEPRYQLAIFDFDGTLADSYPWFIRNVNQVAGRYRFRAIQDHEIETLRGYDARRIIAHVRLPLWKMPLVARHMRRRMAADLSEIPLFEGMADVIRGLREAGVRIAVVTSNSRANVERVLGPLTGEVEHFGCGASVFGKRPLLRRALRHTGVPAARAVCVGDEVRDLHAAQAEGIDFAAVAWGYTRGDALREHRPRWLAETPAELLARLRGANETLDSRLSPVQCSE